MNTAINKRRSAFVDVTSDPAECLLKREKLEIAWIKCKISELVTPVKCFRCQMYGHMSKVCKETESTDKCLRCCEKGHKAKDCSNRRKCIQCKGDGHAVGTMNCPVFRDLVSAMKRDLRDTVNQK